MTNVIEADPALHDDDLERVPTSGVASAFAAFRADTSGAALTSNPEAERVGATDAVEFSRDRDRDDVAEVLFERTVRDQYETEDDTETLPTQEAAQSETGSSRTTEFSETTSQIEGITATVADAPISTGFVTASYIPEMIAIEAVAMVSAPAAMTSTVTADASVGPIEAPGIVQHSRSKGEIDGGSEQVGTGPMAVSTSNVDIFDSISIDMGTGLTFTLNNTGGVEAGSDALAGFTAAAALWSNLLTDNVNIVLNVGFQNLGANTLGQAGSTAHVLRYTDVRTALTNDATSADDTAGVNSLDAGTSFTAAQQNASGVFALDNDGSADNTFLSVNAANAKALGFTQDVNGNTIGGATPDANITFNNQFSWDFDQSDGVGAGLQDFVGVAFHEIGHALGFTSGVDILDQNTTTNLEGFAIHGILDLFRYSANSVATFNTRDLGYNTTSYFSLDRGATNLGLFSTGVANGDGEQASHWKDNQLTGVQLGIMDPTALPAGNANVVSELDLRAFDVIGWNRASAVQPVELFNAANVSQGTFATIAAAEAAASAGFRVVVNAATYTANPETVTVDQNNMTYELPAGVTPTLSLGGTATMITTTGTGDANLTGNALANVLVGNAGGNSLDGGAGADQLVGGSGNDTYVFDDLGDVAIEALNGGADTIQSAVSVIVGANIENVVLTGTANNGILGNALANNLTGNSGDNGIAAGEGNDTITAGAGADVLDGQAGTDTLIGGTGVDTYFVDNAGDTVTEDSNSGEFDTIWTTVSYTLPDNVEILILNGGNLDINGTGNDGPTDDVVNLMLGNIGINTLTTFGGNDVILGLDGADTINAGGGADLIAGGAGADILTGGADNDLFSYAAIGEAGDLITDFSATDLDLLDLRVMFTTFAGFAGATAADAIASGHLRVDQSGLNTAVFVDADGGGDNNVLLALLQNTTATVVDDLILVG